MLSSNLKQNHLLGPDPHDPSRQSNPIATEETLQVQNLHSLLYSYYLLWQTGGILLAKH